MTDSGIQEVAFDIRGRICPSTLLLALKEMNGRSEALRKGEVRLRFLADNRDSVVTIPSAARNMGYGVAVDKVSHHYEILIGAPQDSLCQRPTEPGT